MLSLIKKIWPWGKLFYESDARKEPRNYFITQTADGTRILPAHWDLVVKPGFSISLRSQGNMNWLVDTLANIADEKNEKAKRRAARDSNEFSQNVAYVARIYQEKSDSRQPQFLREKTFMKPLTTQIQGFSADANAVLYEVRNVFLGLSKGKSPRCKVDLWLRDVLETLCLSNEPFLPSLFRNRLTLYPPL